MPVAVAPPRSGTLPSDLPWIATAGSPEVLAAAVRDAACLAVWQREPAPHLEDWLDALPAERLPAVRAWAAPEEVHALVLGACRDAGHGAGGPAAALAGDAADLARRFCRLGRVPAAELRLDAIDHDACWRFHRDRVALRLVVTYRGRGTELVAPDRAEEALRLQRAYRGPVQAVGRRAVALFRGSPGGDSGVVHRSPPATGLTRLLLRLSVPAA